MANKKEEHSAHSVASKIAKALLNVKPAACRHFAFKERYALNRHGETANGKRGSS